MAKAKNSSSKSVIAEYKKISSTLLLKEYETWLKQKDGKYDNYLRVAHLFLVFCKEHNLGIDEVSFQMYATQQDLKKSMKSILNKFIKFSDEQGHHDFVYDRKRGPLPKNAVILAFLDSLSHPPSRDSYGYALNRYDIWCKDGELPLLSSETLLAFLDYLEDFFTKNRYLSVVKSLAKWVLENRESIPEHRHDTLEEIQEIEKITFLKSFKADGYKYYKDAFTKKEREFFLETCPDSESKLLFSLMAFEALRISEACDIKIRDINHLNREIYVEARGGFLRQAVKMSETTARYYKDYMSEHHLEGPALFPNTAKSKAFKWFKKILEQTGIHKEKRVSPHSLRHTALQILMDDGHSLEDVQRHGRHKRITSTLVYVKENKADKSISENKEE
ncbi:tyrosine-type recombinase/integrase [Sediminitomix flava]|uniref:Site-specific recombinase XerD n=1 Tax=Sediminitomix flava TaxID=379075 RepID=A0A315ZC56_SEDFL|nr:site-specific integrase [Sediminitomix flava]PWJ42900.1 site-specific recombinase XerD [Sediminitomix flava]